MKSFKKLFLLLLALAIMISAAACGGSKSGDESETTAAPTTSKNVDASTAAPSSTDEPIETEPLGPEIILVDMMTTFYSTGEENGWQNYIYSLGETNTGKQYIRFTLSPQEDGIDGTVNFTDSSRETASVDDLSIRIRMNAEGMFDALNGDNFEKLADVAYTSGNQYLVELECDMDGKTYTAYVTVPEGERVMFAENYAFNSTAADTDDLGQMFIITAGDNERLWGDYVKRLAIFEPGKEYISKGENFGWQQNGIYPGKVYTGKLKIDWDMTCLVDGIDGSIDFTDIDIDVFGFVDLAMLVRMAGDFGYFDVRNGDQGQQCLVQVPYALDVTYHLEIECDMDAGLYSCWVTPPDGERTKIAEDYQFRITAQHAKNVGQVYVISRHASDQLKLENLVIKEL
ncbi:MAG: hypothetical protein PHV32_10990 [Eubacteriales bacterium]|nr:hypothetical protein [Eubacteriales bacterium]